MERSTEGSMERSMQESAERSMEQSVEGTQRGGGLERSVEGCIQLLATIDLVDEGSYKIGNKLFKRNYGCG